MEKYIRVTDFEKHEENPFVPNLIQDMAVRNRKQYLRSDNGSKSMVVVHDETNTALAHTGFFQIEEVDQNQFVKLYVKELASHKNLTAQGRNVLFYLMSLLRPGNDRVRVRIDEALEYLEYKSKKSYFMGIANLLEKEVIARTKYDDEFFINPVIMFNGDRITLAKVYVKKKTEAAKKAGNQAQLDIFEYMDNPKFQSTRNQFNRLQQDEMVDGESSTAE
ncbi:RepA protein [Larkinella humicola]|uniref:RepA protein n=1 Tax=Larkinella humicola TaxID=2607654 RepID=A0A5N1J2U9_9BACT|nr:RepA protein [Larkinella humicola]KAA9340347.1 RepA protein [Larkinella humicola]